jgi:sulfoxide reductase heme-binding subunit YedZ
MTNVSVSKVLLFACLGLPTVQFGFVVAQKTGIGTQAQTIIELSGLWSIWLLIVVMAIRPMQQIFGLPVLVRFRRMVGLYAAWYGLIHTLGYLFDNEFDWSFVFMEIVSRPFLSTGTLALILLVPLAATSTDGMVRRLGGKRWRRLQQIVYAVLIAAVAHYILEVRLSPTQPILQAGLLGWLLHYRAIVYLRRRRGATAAIGPVTLLWTGVCWAVLTGLMELWFFHVNTSVRLGAVLESYLDTSGGLRPAVTAAFIFLAVSAAKLVHEFRKRGV